MAELTIEEKEKKLDELLAKQIADKEARLDAMLSKKPTTPVTQEDRGVGSYLTDPNTWLQAPAQMVRGVANSVSNVASEYTENPYLQSLDPITRIPVAAGSAYVKGLAELPPKEIARQVGSDALGVAASFIPGGWAAKAAYSVFGSQAWNALIDQFGEDARTAKEKADSIAIDFLAEVIPGVANVGAKAARPISSRVQKYAQGGEEAAKRAAAESPGAMAAAFNTAGRNSAYQLKEFKDLAKATDTLLEENLSAGIDTSKMSPVQAFQQFKENYHTALDNYTTKQGELLATADKELGGVATLSADEIAVLQKEEFLKEALDELAQTPGAVVNGKLTPTATMGAIRAVRETKKAYDYYNPVSVADEGQMQRVKLKSKKLTEIEESLKAQLDKAVESSTIDNLTFKDLNKKVSDLLEYKDVIGTRGEPGIFENRVEGRLTNERMSAIDQPGIGQGSLVRQGKDLVEGMLGKSRQAEAINTNLQQYSNIVDDYNRIRGVRSKDISVPGPQTVTTPVLDAIANDTQVLRAISALSFDAPLPRDAELIYNTEKYMEVLRNNFTPDELKVFVVAARNKNPYAQKRALYQLMQIKPDVFEESATGLQSEVRVGNGFALADPAEAQMYSQQLSEEFSRGEIDDTEWYAQQKNALMNPNNLKLIPRPGTEEVEPKKEETLYGNKPSMLERLSNSSSSFGNINTGDSRLGKLDDKFRGALGFVKEAEGGYVNDPRDRGGATNQGITQKTYDVFRSRKGLDPKDVKGITSKEVDDIYKTLYWEEPELYKLPDKVATAVFDAAVHHGPSKAIKFLQRSLGVADDGVIGPATLRALKTADQDTLLEDMLLFREQFLKNIAKQGDNNAFLKGWLNRISNLKEFLA